jgi:acylpyruvate hydrolase
MRFANLRTTHGLRLHLAAPHGYVEIKPTYLNEVATFSSWIAMGPDQLIQASKSAVGGTGIEGATHGPAVDRPGKIICVGRNYSQHIAEMKNEPSGWPEVFARFSSTIVGPFDDIVRPRVSKQLDYEGELAVVIGKPGRYISAARAMDHVFGFTVVNEATARDWQDGGRQWTPGKNFDRTFPIGPEVVTADEVDWHDLALETRVNGQTVQSARTSQMLFDIPTLIEFISCWLTLEAGDLIATGTPGGVGAGQSPQRFLDIGDTVEVSVEGVGAIRSKVVADERAPSTDRWTQFLVGEGR